MEILVTASSTDCGKSPPTNSCHSVRSPFSDLPAVDVHAAHAGLRLERDEHGMRHLRHGAASEPVLFGKDHNASAFRRFIGQRCQLRGIGQFLEFDSVRRDKFRCLTISEGDGAGLVQEQHIHVTRGFGCSAAHGKHVLLHQPVDARDADGAQESTDGGGDEAHQQSHQHGDRERHSRVQTRRTSGS